MKHEDGYCDECGAEIAGAVQITLDGLEVCDECALPASGSRPEGAYDRG